MLQYLYLNSLRSLYKIAIFFLLLNMNMLSIKFLYWNRTYMYPFMAIHHTILLAVHDSSHGYVRRIIAGAEDKGSRYSSLVWMSWWTIWAKGPHVHICHIPTIFCHGVAFSLQLYFYNHTLFDVLLLFWFVDVLACNGYMEI